MLNFLKIKNTNTTVAVPQRIVTIMRRGFGGGGFGGGGRGGGRGFGGGMGGGNRSRNNVGAPRPAATPRPAAAPRAVAPRPAANRNRSRRRRAVGVGLAVGAGVGIGMAMGRRRRHRHFHAVPGYRGGRAGTGAGSVFLTLGIILAVIGLVIALVNGDSLLSSGVQTVLFWIGIGLFVLGLIITIAMSARCARIRRNNAHLIPQDNGQQGFNNQNQNNIPTGAPVPNMAQPAQQQNFNQAPPQQPQQPQAPVSTNCPGCGAPRGNGQFCDFCGSVIR